MMLQLIVLAICAFLYWFIHLRAGNVKKLEAQLLKEQKERAKQNRQLFEMYSDAGRLTRLIANASTYEDYLNAEESLNNYADTYRHLEGFAEVVERLNDLLQKVRRLVRMQDRARPFDYQYNDEG